MQHPDTAMSNPAAAGASRARSYLYLGTALAMSLTVFWGFGYTYFTPLFAGAYPPVSPVVHVHGWSFFLWYLLLPLQASLIAANRRRLHMALGGASLALAAVMVFSGVLAAAVRIDHGLSATNPDEFTIFWQGFGQLVLYSGLLFAGFYAVAIAKRRQPGVHKRMMILASASALPAATFRILVGLTGAYWLQTPGWIMPTAFLLPAVFVLVCMFHDLRVQGTVHRAYVVGLPLMVAVFVLGLAIAGTAAGEAVSTLVALF